jgi:hypothetical protein
MMQYFLRHFGWGSNELKRLSFSIRAQLLEKSAEDLFVLTSPVQALQQGPEPSHFAT